MGACAGQAFEQLFLLFARQVTSPTIILTQFLDVPTGVLLRQSITNGEIE